MTLFKNPFRTLAAVVVSAVFAGSALACEPDMGDCVEVGKWQLSLGIGAGVRTNPLEATPDIPLVLIPQVNYNGERFFIQNLDFGFILWDSDVHQVNLLATPSYDQVLFHRWSPSNFFLDSHGFATAGKETSDKDAIDIPKIGPSGNELIAPDAVPLQRRELRDRHMAGMAGFEYIWSAAGFEIQAQYLSDFTQVHSGEELRIALATHWQSGKHQWLLAIGGNWQSAEVVNYYYGVTTAEADHRGSYRTGSAVSPLVRLEWNYALTERWDLRLLTSYRALPNEISASPLLNDNKVVTLFFGGVYHF